jgi:Carboxypeptidase regulatory-like domain/TonB dependent receptor
MRTKCTLWVSALVFTGAVLLNGQAITGDLTINVSDPNGAAVGAAKLELTSSSEGATLPGSTNDVGDFTFGQLKPGSYQLKVSAAGFQPQQVNDITIQLGQRARVAVQLTLGRLSESVTVSADAATLLNAESATQGQVIQSKPIEELPLNGRNFVQLAQLTTGATPLGAGNSPATSWTGRSDTTLSIAGLRESDVSFLLNGIETRNARFGNAGIRPSVDAIQEFNVQHSSFTAEYGRSAAIVNTAIKSGTNDLHMVAFDLVRNREFDANNFFANSAGQGRPPFSQNNFGATASGPVYIPKLYNGRNRTFFLFNYEGFRERQGITTNGLYPSAAQLAGNLADNSAGTGLFPTSSAYCQSNPGSQHCVDVIDPRSGAAFPNNVIPPSRLDPITQKALPYTPAPNIAVSPSASFPSFNTFGAPKRVTDWDQYNARIDHRITDRDFIYGSYSNSNESQLSPALRFLGGDVFPMSDQLWTATYVRTITPSIVNELRFGHNDSKTFRTSEGSNGTNYAQSVFGLKNTSPNPFDFGIPAFSISGFGAIGSISEAIGADDENFQYVDNLSVMHGQHNFKAGIQVIHEKFFQITDFNGNPTFSFDGRFTGASGIGIADFLLGVPYQASGALGDSSQHLVTTYWGGYLEDNWKVTRNLTLNLGLRYEFAASPREEHNRSLYFDTNLLRTVVAGQGVRPQIVDPDYNNFAPRFGFAYQPAFAKNTVIRGGAGIYYATDNFNEEQFKVQGAPFYQSQTINSNPTTPTLFMDQLLPSFTSSPSTNPFTFNRLNRTPYISQWTFDIQHSFAGNNFIELGYLGSTGQKLPQRRNLNIASFDPSGTTSIASRVPYPDYGFILYDYNAGWSSYQAFTARYERRFQSGFYFLGSYTFQKALDLGGTDDFSQISARYKTFDRGHTDYDVPHRLVFSYLYELPFGRGKHLLGNASGWVNALVGGWQLNGITTLASGQFRTVTVGTDWLNLGAFTTSVPNRIGDEKQGRSLPGHYLNAAAFDYPRDAAGDPIHVQGNSGRNQIEIPGTANWDASLFKNTRIGERFTTQLRFEAFNIFNRTHFNAPNLSWTSPNFGQITSTLIDARRLQLGLRLMF